MVNEKPAQCLLSDTLVAILMRVVTIKNGAHAVYFCCPKLIENPIDRFDIISFLEQYGMEKKIVKTIRWGNISGRIILPLCDPGDGFPAHATIHDQCIMITILNTANMNGHFYDTQLATMTNTTLANNKTSAINDGLIAKKVHSIHSDEKCTQPFFPVLMHKFQSTLNVPTTPTIATEATPPIASHNSVQQKAINNPPQFFSFWHSFTNWPFNFINKIIPLQACIMVTSMRSYIAKFFTYAQKYI
jgi:hypothetical protein